VHAGRPELLGLLGEESRITSSGPENDDDLEADTRTIPDAIAPIAATSRGKGEPD